MKIQNIEALVSSRICHDLISPVGAIGNGVELLDGIAATTPELGLISDSVNNANAKLRYFRICFGQCTPGTMIATSEAEAISTAKIQTTRLKVDWQIPSAELPRDKVKHLFLLLMCVETALPLGGTIALTENEGRLVIAADGPRIMMLEAWRVFEGDASVPITPAQVQFPLAHAVGPNIHINNTEKTLRVTF